MAGPEFVWQCAGDPQFERVIREARVAQEAYNLAHTDSVKFKGGTPGVAEFKGGTIRIGIVMRGCTLRPQVAVPRRRSLFEAQAKIQRRTDAFRFDTVYGAAS